MSGLSRIIGATLIFSGTCVGAGMLALPLATAQGGFFPTLLVFVITCFVMCLAGILLIEINSWLSEESNMISMAKDTLGLPGQIITWFLFLLLLYAALGAYISGSAPMFGDLLVKLFNIHLSSNASAIIVTIIIGAVIYFGTHAVDEINRGLMIVLIISYTVLVYNYIGNIKLDLLTENNPSEIFLGVPIIVASFTGHIAIPTLRTYLHSDFKHLKHVVILGCTIPLVLYSLWLLVTLGNIPLAGENGLHAISHGNEQMIALNNALAQGSPSTWLQYSVSGLVISALITSFLGVTMSLTDFISDGLKLNAHKHSHRTFALLLSIIPPLVWAIFNPDGFTRAIDYAGAIVSVLLLILPVAMAWRGRYYLYHESNSVKLLGGKPMLIFIVLAALVVLYSEFFSSWYLNCHLQTS